MKDPTPYFHRVEFVFVTRESDSAGMIGVTKALDNKAYIALCEQIANDRPWFRFNSVTGDEEHINLRSVLFVRVLNPHRKE